MSRTLPNIGLAGGYAEGEDAWTDSMNANLLKLSVLVQGGVLDQVAAVPAAPNEGDIYILTADPNGKAVAVFSNGAWTYYPPIEGWLLYDKTKDAYVQYDGAAWKVLATGGGSTGIEEAPDDGKLYGRKSKAWAEVVSGGGGGGAAGVLRARRYWRFTHWRTNTDTLGLQEMTCYDANGNVLPISGIASRTAYSGGTVIGNIIDADKNNVYSSNSSAMREWVHVDMGASVAIARIALRARNDGDGVSQFPTEFIAFAGDDATKMEFIAGLSSASQPVNQGGTCNFMVPPTAGSSNGTNIIRPTIIQKGSKRTSGNGTLSLAAAPVVGNHLVWISNSYTGGMAPSNLAKWSRVYDVGMESDYGQSTARFQKAQVFTTIATADMTKDFAYACGDVGNSILLELDRVDRIEAQAWRVTADGNTGEAWMYAPKMVGDSLRVAFVEHDAVGAVNFTQALAGEKIDFNGTYNHAGQAYLLAKNDPTNLKLGIDGPTYPNALYVNIGKFA